MLTSPLPLLYFHIHKHSSHAIIFECWNNFVIFHSSTTKKIKGLLTLSQVGEGIFCRCRTMKWYCSFFGWGIDLKFNYIPANTERLNILSLEPDTGSDSLARRALRLGNKRKDVHRTLDVFSYLHIVSYPKRKEREFLQCIFY